MHNLSERRVFSKNVRLDLDNLYVTNSKDFDKPKVSCYSADQDEPTLLFNKEHRYRKKKRKESNNIWLSVI